MCQFSSVDQALDYAIARERVAYDFYSQLAGWVKRPEIKTRLQEFAQQENQHRKKLEALKAGKASMGEDDVEGFVLADIDEEVRLDQHMNYAAVLMVAMKREKEAYDLYTRLARTTRAEVLQRLFQELAQEEASHKMWLELEYDWTRG
jgi:rubrerythrin